mgnify:CR=1 FL=1
MATVGPSTGVYGRDAILAARKNASSQTQNSNTNPSSVGQAASSGGSKTSTSTPTSSAKRVKVNPDGKAPKGLSVGTIVETAGGDYEIIGFNTDGSYKSKKVSSGNVATSTQQQQVKQQQPTTVSGGKTPTTYTYGGKEYKGYIEGGKTYDEQGNRVPAGSIVTAANGKKYLKLDDGSGVDVTKAFKTELYKEDKDEKGNKILVPQNRTAYIVNGKTYDEYGRELSVGDIVKAAGDKYYQMTAGGGVEYTPPASLENALVEFEDPFMRSIAEIISNLYNEMPQLAETMTLEQAIAQAAQRLNPQYNQAMEQAMTALDEKALKTGFYGQLPTEALRRETAGKLEVERLNSIYDLANQLFGQSEESAYRALDAATQEHQNKLNTLLNLLGLYQGERAYRDSREDIAAERELAEARLTGNYKGNPTLEFLDYMRLLNNSGGSGGGSNEKEQNNVLNKTQILAKLKDLEGYDIYKKLNELYNDGLINRTTYDNFVISEAKGYTTSQADVDDMLDRWYKSMSGSDFDQVVRNALSEGALNKDQYTDWYNRKFKK